LAAAVERHFAGYQPSFTDEEPVVVPWQLMVGWSGDQGRWGNTFLTYVEWQVRVS